MCTRPPGGLVQTQTPGLSLGFQLSSSGVGPDNRHLGKFLSDVDAAAWGPDFEDRWLPRTHLGSGRPGIETQGFGSQIWCPSPATSTGFPLQGTWVGSLPGDHEVRQGHLQIHKAPGKQGRVEASSICPGLLCKGTEAEDSGPEHPLALQLPS